METEVAMQPPRIRLHKLKSSADFPSDEFNHSIKTWVNMASLLVKQGNMAQSNNDDENAYISYVRACIIITKIIPHQALYPTMMNDIACIDLRQKILGIISRIGHLERRLLKCFEQENQERYNTTSSVSAPSSRRTSSSRHNVDRKQEQDECEQYQGEDVSVIQRTSSRQSNDDDVVQDREQEQLECDAEEQFELNYEIPNSQLALELNPEVHATYHNLGHERAMTGDDLSILLDLDSEKKDMRMPNGMLPTLKKKSSNEDDRSFLLSPECQPNYSAMPSELFAREREDGHVRRCTSTDAIRASVHFSTGSPNCDAPAIPPRSEKRNSMWTPSATLIERNSRNNSIRNDKSSKNSSKKTSTETVPDYRSTASSIEEREGEKVIYTREAMKSRLSNRKTMSFESRNYSSPDVTNTAVPKITPSKLRKSNSISKLQTFSSKSKKELMPPTPRLSVENMDVVEGSGSPSSLLSTTMSVISVSINLPSSSPPSPASSTSSTPSSSPRLKSKNPLLQEKGHKYSHSMTSITSGSTATTIDKSSFHLSPLSSSHLSLTSSSTGSLASTSSTVTSQSQAQPQHMEPPSISGATSTNSASSAMSPTFTAVSTWSTGSKTGGLLRKIRSKPKMKDQVFEIVVAVPSPPQSSR
ncbi:hypothetical protein BGZ58_006533 [Dissophora ornata]|nr:hypothetical protein BGZ58_006533 [Dissophora ornata]